MAARAPTTWGEVLTVLAVVGGADAYDGARGEKSCTLETAKAAPIRSPTD